MSADSWSSTSTSSPKIQWSRLDDEWQSTMTARARPLASALLKMCNTDTFIDRIHGAFEVDKGLSNYDRFQTLFDPWLLNSWWSMQRDGEVADMTPVVLEYFANLPKRFGCRVENLRGWIKKDVREIVELNAMKKERVVEVPKAAAVAVPKPLAAVAVVVPKVHADVLNVDDIRHNIYECRKDLRDLSLDMPDDCVLAWYNIGKADTLRKYKALSTKTDAPINPVGMMAFMTFIMEAYGVVNVGADQLGFDLSDQPAYRKGMAAFDDLKSDNEKIVDLLLRAYGQKDAYEKYVKVA